MVARIMRTRRLLIWIAISAALFALPHQCETFERAAEARRRVAFDRRMAEILTWKASECRRLEPLARLRGDLKEADLLDKAARRYQELANYHAR